MERKCIVLLCLMLCMALVLGGCGEPAPAATDPTAANGDSGATYETYEEAVNAKDYAAAYSLLLKSDTASETELGKYIVLPTSVVGHDTYSEINATLTYDDRGLITKAEVAGDETVEFTYNDSGKLVLQVEKSESGSEIRRYEYTYDDNGNCLTKSRIGGSSEEYIAYTYNDKGQLTRETVTQKYIYQSDDVTVWNYTYDADGNLVSRLNDKGGMYYTYDAAGRVTEEKEAYEGSDSFNKYVYAYDEQGRMVKERYESAESWSEYAYKYDARGVRYVDTYTLSDETATYTTTLDADGNITAYDLTASYGTTAHAEYDAAGNIVKKDMTWESGRAQTYTFAYNEYGYRTKESCKNAEKTLYEYTVTYEVMYFENGAPDVSDYLKEMQEKDSIDLWF